ncbi:MAG TPA: hypothetical protein VL242_40610 [Sorangium sp.]|nr:hypothetical protein [Sorangium sp.]
MTVALAALAPALHGCAQIAGLEDREVIPVLTIASNQAEPHGIALDEEVIYWTNGSSDGAQGSSTGGALRMQIKDDPAVIDLLAPSSEAPAVIALDATHIYWSSTDTGFEGECEGGSGQRDKLWRMPKEGQFPAAGGELLWGSCGAVEELALNADNVYSARPSAERITWIPKAGGNRKDLTEGGEPFGVAADGARVYWTDRGRNEIFFDDTSDSAPGEPLLTDLEDAPGLLALDEANLYWLTPSGVMGYPRSGGDAPVRLLEGLSSPPTGIAAHGDYLYVTVRSAGSVHRVRKDGTGDPRVIASGQGGPTSIAADRTGAYWTNSDSGEIVRFTDE